MTGKIKFAIIGAGSVSFCPATIGDILLNPSIREVDLDIALMDIAPEALKASLGYARQALKAAGREAGLTATTRLKEALEGADFVVSAIELNRYYYWSMDFHIPRRYGFRQVYGENGGPGGMFHALRNMGPTLEIAHAMEEVCPEAWLLNYTNPEAKLIEAVGKLSKTRVVGLCHGEGMGVDQLSQIIQIPRDDLDTQVAGLNHFGWFTKIARKSTGEDLYPLLREKEAAMDWLAHWDELGLSRLMLRTFGLYPYPGTNHIGEYIGWSDQMLASALIQYFYDPAGEDPWAGGKVPEFIYSFSGNPTSRPLHPDKPVHSAGDPAYVASFTLADSQLHSSGEYGIPIAEAIFFDKPRHIGAVNVPNDGYIPNLPQGMAVEVPALVDGRGIHPVRMDKPLPVAITQMIAAQGAIHQLLIEAYQEKSRNKLLQAMLIDPTVSTYNNAVALINEMCDRQKEILPELYW